MSRKAVLVLILVLVIGATLAGAFLGAGMDGAGPLFFRGENAVGLIYIDGIIGAGDSGEGVWGAVTGSDQVVSLLKSAREDPSVKAVVIRINSPGGTAAASQEIAEEVLRLRDAGKKVVTSMGDIAASGGYWVAAPADRIVANPATVTGSIGVIMQLSNLVELYRKLGIEVETIKSGPHKDIGSASRPLTEEERRILQGMIDDIFDQFVSAVAEGRNMSREQVEQVADGRIFTGRQAMQLGLVDEMGNLTDAIELAAELAGIDEGFTVKRFGEETALERFLRRLSGRFSGYLPFQLPPAFPGFN